MAEREWSHGYITNRLLEGLDMRRCTRQGCTSTAAAFPKLSFKDAAENQSSAILKLSVCSEHMEADKNIYLAQVSWPAVQHRHREHYGLAPILDETVLVYVPLDSVEGQTFLALLEEREQRPPLVALPAVEEVSEQEFQRLLRESKRTPPS